jgi:hypothetical protein
MLAKKTLKNQLTLPKEIVKDLLDVGQYKSVRIISASVLLKMF